MDLNHGNAIHCRGLIKTYGTNDAQVQALRGVDLDVRFGELLMLAGPSGCGKTTLISIIAGILDQDAGQCILLGHDFQQMGPDERANFRGTSVGFVFQSFNLLPTLTAAENVAMPLIINGMTRKAAVSRAGATLEGVGLGERAEALAAQLSGGQKQRVAIARALVHEPKVIICDEPTSNLDHAAGHQVMDILRRVARTPERAVLVVTHDSRIFEFADRIAHMDDGMITDVTETAHMEASS
ncbi:ABC transporter ATP-binding protein [Sulfuriferula sp. AH1]|uniref:ABC transporter ATP-binding protein n=1 Tax=Sulfuriferula sp. AH1 TaxID=1985873 RepID=UPI000B3B1D04|nr:ABC transporter ATP-binding protein [Sulfuriferula sp. AH1]ARU32428.1 ABC transporter ATP-binding protein [Sulfuriferula sp. AH1]